MQAHCYKTFFNILSLSNMYNKKNLSDLYKKIKPVMDVSILVLLICLVLGLEIWHDKYEKDVHSKRTTIGEFTLLLHGLPHGKRYAGLPVRRKLLELMKEEGFDVASVNFAHNVSKYEKEKKKLGQKVTHHNTLQKKETESQTHHEPSSSLTDGSRELMGLLNQGQNEDPSQLGEATDRTKEAQLKRAPSRKMLKARKDILSFQKRIQVLETMFRKDDPESMIGKAFISFERLLHKRQCLKTYGRSGWPYKFLQICWCSKKRLYMHVESKKFRLSFEKASEPNDVIWGNLKYNGWFRLLMSLLGMLIAFLVMIISFFLLYTLKVQDVSSFG